ncbi:MAG: homocysteine S-methyltransferase family protein [Clostridia bacterium]|nr:homocysteine S-methyltransferase family protein [Clostridia bacterium]
MFREFLKQNIVRLDGGMGTLLQAQGLQPGELPERWNITHPEVITAIHRAYFEAGSHVVSTNTFGANALKFEDSELDAVVSAAFRNAKAAKTGEDQFIALDIGPSGKLLKPFGDLDFEDAVALFAKTVKLGVKYGADLIFIETMNDSYETKAAVLAAKENSDLPILVSNAYGADGKLMTGASPAAMVALLEGLGVDAIGANCSLGPKQLAPVAKELLNAASVPVILKPNAGLPAVKDGRTVFDVAPAEFADEVAALMQDGVRVVGGCCGTTPDYIRALTEKTQNMTAQPTTQKRRTVVSSYTHAVAFGDEPILIGERINPTGKKRFKQALLENDMDYLLQEGVHQQEKGVHVLDVNVGLPGIDEEAMLTRAVCELQAICDLPLQIDTADPQAMAAAMRRVNGKPLVNSVSGKQESMDLIFPLVKRYGGTVIALTLDENGIPDTADGRVAIAKRIVKTAAAYGIEKHDLIFDTLAMTVSADTRSATVTLEALRRIREELGCHTSLGVSNVSFGLPVRDAVNSTFFALALENGLSAAIMNPYSSPMMQVYYAYRALKGMDRNCEAYIAASGEFQAVSAPVTVAEKTAEEQRSALQRAIAKGLKDEAAAQTAELLKTAAPLDIVNGEIIPALDAVGKGFEQKTVYLPQLLMSAEAAQSAFEHIKAALPQKSGGPKVVIATVKGDIHDIGKNIVKLLLENYGFTVIDLGRDVPPEAVTEAVLAHNAPLLGLSALMTTTVPAMEDTIAAVRKRVPSCKIMVGGAVLNAEYAQRIGADFYAKDAMEGVRYAETVK